MALEATGKLHLIGDAVQVSEKFTKREFVVAIADNPKYPQLVQFQLTGDRIGQLDDFEVGDAVRLEFSLRGREWRSPKGEVKYFNSLDVWRVEEAEGDRKTKRDDAPAQHTTRRAPPRDADVPTGSAGNDDDLPF